MSPYASRAQLRAHLGFPTSTTTDDALLDAALDAATEAVDAYTGRSFAVPADDAVDTTRIYRRDNWALWSDVHRLYIDDVVSVSLVETSANRVDWTTTTATYWLEPANTDPKNTITATSALGPWVRVTGIFGRASLPSSVSQATLIMAARLFKRKDSPSGTEGFGEFGVVRVSRSQDPDFCALLDPFREVMIA